MKTSTHLWWRGLALGALGMTGCVDAVIGEPYVCEVSGKPYRAGESFPSSDGCNTCTCAADGDVACTLRACADGGPGADGGGTDPGTCTLNGRDYAVGDIIPSGRDDCELTCRCTESGLECPDIGCPLATCDYAGRTLREGESVQASDGCNTCTCMVDGNVACTEIACGGGTCTLGDTTFQAGESVICADGCNTCFCGEGGDWGSTLIGCGALPTLTACPANVVESADTVNALYLEGDALAVEATFASCSNMNTLSLCVDGAFAESAPVQARLRLVGAAPCTTGSVRRVFDIALLRQMFADAYQTEHGEISVMLMSDSTRYTF